MCVYSMVHDYWNKYPWPESNNWPITNINIEKIKKSIEDYHKSIEAAKIVDNLTGQPDCEDLEKTKLKDKIKELEERIAMLENSKPKRLIKLKDQKRKNK